MIPAPYAYVDHARLVADLKAGDAAAVAHAYRQVFGSSLGRFVLSHQLAMAGGGHVRGEALTPAQSRYHDGREDHAKTILEMAGYGPLSAAHLLAASSLEGQDHDRHDADHGRDAGHDDGRGFSGPDRLQPD